MRNTEYISRTMPGRSLMSEVVVVIDCAEWALIRVRVIYGKTREEDLGGSSPVPTTLKSRRLPASDLESQYLCSIFGRYE